MTIYPACHKHLKFRPDIAMLYHSFDDGVVLFDPDSSNTTLYHTIVLWLIELTATDEFEYEQVLNRLIDDYKNDDPMELSQLLDRTLNSLMKLGFVQRI